MQTRSESSCSVCKTPGNRTSCTLATLVLSLVTLPALAQQDCSWSSLSDPPRQLITCGEALTLERVPGSEITIFERSGDGPPRVIELDNGAIFIEVLPGSQPTQIRTPHAIAAVRGTTYVVDAREASTSVFVIEGSVEVSKSGAASTVSLGPGQGVDVDAVKPLELKDWDPKRVSALLSLFGR